MKLSLRKDALTNKGKSHHSYHSKLKKDTKVKSRRQLRRKHNTFLEQHADDGLDADGSPRW